MEAASGGQQQRQLPPGAMLDDKYRIEGLLAVGGMGAVYVGTHIKLRKRVAIKVLNPALSNPAMVERFHREAITASQIGHEGIAQVTDIGTSAEGEPFLVMEYLEGESLANRLKASGPLPIEVACELGCSILAPLEAAHRAGIVHRDLKPDNVFLVRQSRGEMVKLLDFGISRSQGLEGEFRLTTTGLVLGTPYYMSPEQARGDAQIGIAADLYAFGVIMYEMLVGNVPIQGDNYNQLMYRVMTADYVRLGDMRSDVPQALLQIVAQAMHLEPKQRPASAAQLEQMLLAFCRPTFREHTIERISTPALPHRPSMPGVSTGTDRTVLATPSAVGTGPVKKKSRALPLVLGLGLVAGLAIGAVALLKTNSQPTATSPTSGASPTPTPPSTPAVRAKANVAATTPAVPTNAGGSGEVQPARPPETITLKFAVTPKTATVKLDGVEVKDGEAVVPKDGAAHELAISAPGFASHTEKLKFDESQRLTIPLQKVVSGRPTGKDPPTGKDRRTDRIDTQSPYQ